MKRGYIRRMDKNRTRHDPAGGFDAQVGALLDRVHESASFVDSLMAMPLPGEGSSAPEWDAAVARRLESRLAAAMRAMLDAEPEQKSA